MRRCMTGLVAAAFLLAGCSPAHAPTLEHTVDGVKVARVKPQGAAAVKGTQQTYGWRWAGPIYVYDGTGEPLWHVADAVAGWAASGVDVRLTDAPCTGCVNVSQGVMPDAYWGGYTDCTTDGTYALDCTVVLNQYDSPRVYAAGIALHEVGHSLSMAHNTDFIKGSAMNASISWDTYVTVPSRGDLSTLATHYGL